MTLSQLLIQFPPGSYKDTQGFVLKYFIFILFNLDIELSIHSILYYCDAQSVLNPTSLSQYYGFSYLLLQVFINFHPRYRI